MKLGMRRPSIKKSIAAKTTRRAKRNIKKAIIPGYGKKEADGLKILKRQHIIKYIIKQVLVYGIYLNSKEEKYGRDVLQISR